MAVADGNRCGVDPGERQHSLVWRPPVAFETVHFLLRDELGQAVAHGAAAVGGQTALGPVVELVDDEVAVAGVAQVGASRRKTNAGLASSGRRCRVHAAIRDTSDEGATVSDDQDSLAFRVPVVRRDPASERPTAFALWPAPRSSSLPPQTLRDRARASWHIRPRGPSTTAAGARGRRRPVVGNWRTDRPGDSLTCAGVAPARGVRPKSASRVRRTG